MHFIPTLKSDCDYAKNSTYCQNKIPSALPGQNNTVCFGTNIIMVKVALEMKFYF